MTEAFQRRLDEKKMQVVLTLAEAFARYRQEIFLKKRELFKTLNTDNRINKNHIPFEVVTALRNTCIRINLAKMYENQFNGNIEMLLKADCRHELPFAYRPNFYVNNQDCIIDYSNFHYSGDTARQIFDLSTKIYRNFDKIKSEDVSISKPPTLIGITVDNLFNDTITQIKQTCLNKNHR